jgi:hypothetical protein
MVGIGIRELKEPGNFTVNVKSNTTLARAHLQAGVLPVCKEGYFMQLIYAISKWSRYLQMPP